MFIKIEITQLLMDLLEKFIHPHEPQNSLYLEKFTILYLPKGPDRMSYKNTSFLHNRNIIMINV